VFGGCFLTDGVGLYPCMEHKVSELLAGLTVAYNKICYYLNVKSLIIDIDLNSRCGHVLLQFHSAAWLLAQ